MLPAWVHPSSHAWQAIKLETTCWLMPVGTQPLHWIWWGLLVLLQWHHQLAMLLEDDLDGISPA